MPAWKRLRSTYAHENPYYKIRHDTVIRPDGKEGPYYVVEDGLSAFIIPVTDDQKVLLMKVFRYPTQMESWELPMGAVEDGEDSLAAAQRELQEETGYTAKQWKKLGKVQVSNSKTDGIADIFLCRNLHSRESKPQAEEAISELALFTPVDILEMIARGDITDACTTSSLMLAIAKGELSLN